MTLFYYLLFCVAYIIAFPILCVMSCRHKYKDSIPLRFFFPKNRSKEHYDIWLHACSVGEVQSLQAIIESIPSAQSLLLTVITQTGYIQAKKLYAKCKNLTIGYLPFEIFLPLYSPTCKKLFVFEAELWLMLFVCAKRCGAETKLINARISTRSFSRYKKLIVFYRHFFCFVDSVFSQSNDDTSRLIFLGAKNVQTLGNIKLLNNIKPKIAYKKPESLIVVAASTHANEEILILEAWQNVKSLYHKYNQRKLDSSTIINTQDIIESNALLNNDCEIIFNYDYKRHHFNPLYNINQDIDGQVSIKQEYNDVDDSICISKDSITYKDFSKSMLIVAPRHPERFNSVYELCKKYGKTIRLSSLDIDETLDMDSLNIDILLVDSIGVLINFYAISDIVILGGAFAKIGGHNPLEPAHFHNVLISGVEIFNQKALFEYVSNYYLVDDGYSLSMLLYNYMKLEVSSINKDLCKDMIGKILS